MKLSALAHTLLPVLCTQFFLFTRTTASSTSSSGSIVGNNSYRSITELDQYGSSPQINNARLASALHGALTLVAISIPSNEILVLSLERKLPGVIIPPNKGKVHIIAQERGTKVNAVIGSGMNSDITYIVSLLRKYVSGLWERYDSIPSLDRVAMSATQVMLCFMGYDVQDEINDGIRSILSGNGSRDDTISIARPLACNLLCVEVGNGGICDMKLVDPGGVISESILGRAIGRGCDKTNSLLREKWRCDLCTKDLEEICIEILRKTVKEEGLLSDSDSEKASIVCEVLGKEGLSVKKLPFLRVREG